jgi:hypothetical protein
MKTSISAALFSIAIVLAVFATSCSKSTSSPDFIGTYYGVIGGTGGNNDTIVITQGSSSSAILMASKTSIGSVYNINGTVSGSSLSIPLETFTLNATMDTVIGSGGLSGSTLTINYRFSNTSGVNNYTFTGTKQ